MPRDSFRCGLEALSLLQQKLKYPPKRKLIPGLVTTLVKEANLTGDVRCRYFVLLATCALMGKESMYNSFHSKKRIKNLFVSLQNRSRFRIYQVSCWKE